MNTQNQKTQTKIISQQSKYHERKKTAHQSLSKPNQPSERIKC